MARASAPQPKATSAAAGRIKVEVLPNRFIAPHASQRPSRRPPHHRKERPETHETVAPTIADRLVCPGYGVARLLGEGQEGLTSPMRNPQRDVAPLFVGHDVDAVGVGD